ncbi:MAG: IclR family transcriptional regulator, partial [Halobacteriota archaeon]
EMRYVSRTGQRYQLGLRFARIGRVVQTRNPAFELANAHVNSLAATTEERVQFIAEEHGLGTYLAMETGSRAVRVGFGVGRQIHLHCSSAGKAILSQCQRSRVEAILDRWGLPAYTEHTITDRDEYFDELDRVRERGYAFNREEHVTGVNAAAVPIANEDAVFGALAVSGPSQRLKGDLLESELPDLLLASANEIELNLAYSSDERSDHVVE